MLQNGLQETAGRYLAAALYQKFPEATFLEASTDASGFYVDYIFPTAFEEKLIPSLEESINSLMLKGSKILEMVPLVAAQFLDHRGMKESALSARKSDESLVTLFQIDDFIDLCPSPYTKKFFFTLEPELEIKKNVSRFRGRAFLDKDQLKSYLKDPPQDFFTLAQEMKLIYGSEEQWLWLPKGVTFCEQLIAWWKREHQKQNFQIVQGASLDFDLPRMAEITEGDQVIIRGNIENESISSLQFLAQIPKIFGFEHQILISPDCPAILKRAIKNCGLMAEEGGEKHVELLLKDRWGRQEEGPYLILEGDTLIRSSIPSLGRLMMFIVQQHKGQIPCWCAPEQVRVFAAGDKEYAEAVFKQLQSSKVRATLDVSPEKLKQRIYSALRERVPYIIVVGEKEKRLNKVTVRDSDQTERLIDLESFLREIAIES